jgi:hypothetical protein
MSNFIITDFELENANKLNLIIKPSKNLHKKIDVYDNNNNFLFSIGNYLVPTYSDWFRTHGKEYANIKQKLYHMKNINLIKNQPEVLNSKFKTDVEEKALLFSSPEMSNCKSDSLQYVSSSILWGFKKI